MYNIAIIGSEQLGSLHLQGIKTANLELSIEVVDSNIEALRIAEDRCTHRSFWIDWESNTC